MTDDTQIGPLRLSAVDSGKLTARITWMSVGTGLFLLLLKSGVWWFSGSVSLLASAADSGLDFIAATGTFWAVRIAVAPADAEHRFGHGKAEAFASLLQASLVFASAALIANEALHHFFHPVPLRAETVAIGVMFVSVVATLALVTAQAKVIERTRSVAIKGDRAHYLADLVSNAAAIVGLTLARLTGNPRFDAAAGVLVAAWLVKGAVDVLREASNELLDREGDAADRMEILRLAQQDTRVLGIHQLRTRVSGPYLHVQMHMELEPNQTLAQAHDVVEAAERRIHGAFPAMDLVIHADPYGQSEDHENDFDGLSVGPTTRQQFEI